MMEDMSALMHLFQSDHSRKVQAKKQTFLLKLPLFTLIYQQKGEQNFSHIVEKIKIRRYEFGFNIYQQGKQRTFNYIIKGGAMMFSCKQENSAPVLVKKMGQNDYFGDKIVYNNSKLHSVKSVSNTFVLQLDLYTFYKTFAGHFKYSELNDKIHFLKTLWAFHSLKKKDLQRILLLSKTVSYKKNTVIFKNNELPSYAYLILNGELTLFTSSSNHKYKPFVILGKGQICGIQEIKDGVEFEYGGICTTESTLLLMIEKKLVEEIIIGNINEGIWQGKKSIKEAILKCQQKNRIQSILKENRERQGHILKRKSRYLSKSEHNSRSQSFIVANESVSRANTLKDRSLRDHTLSKVRQTQKELQNNLGLSTYSNSGFTNDKQLLLSYLVRKQKKEKEGIYREMEYQEKKIYLLRELSVKKSSAVKNQKRRLKKSRKHIQSANSFKQQ